MYPDHIFWFVTIILAFAETMCVCYVVEMKMKQMEEMERKAEQKRRERAHNDYCTREVERLYMEGRYKEGYTAK